MKTALRLAVPAAVLALALAGCGSSTPATPGAGGTAGGNTAGNAAGASQSGLTASDFWVKAQDKDMTGAFGTLTNTTDKEIVIEGGTSPQAGMVELHETVDNGSGGRKMQPKDGGFAIPAGKAYELKPGGDHVMLMKLPKPIVSGDEISITLNLKGGGTITITAPAKTFSGAQETYAPKTAM